MSVTVWRIGTDTKDYEADDLPLNRYLVAITIPRAVWNAARCETADSLPVGWDAEPSGRASIGFGSAWLRSTASALLRVPSVVAPDEYNVSINPLHPDFSRVVAVKVKNWLSDRCLTKTA